MSALETCLILLREQQACAIAYASANAACFGRVELLECFIWCVIDRHIELFVSYVLDAGLVSADSSKVIFRVEIVAGEYDTTVCGFCF